MPRGLAAGQARVLHVEGSFDAPEVGNDGGALDLRGTGPAGSEAAQAGQVDRSKGTPRARACPDGFLLRKSKEIDQESKEIKKSKPPQLPASDRRRSGPLPATPFRDPRMSGLVAPMTVSTHNPNLAAVLRRDTTVHPARTTRPTGQVGRV